MFLVFYVCNDESYCCGGWDDFDGQYPTFEEAYASMDQSARLLT